MERGPRLGKENLQSRAQALADRAKVHFIIWASLKEEVDALQRSDGPDPADTSDGSLETGIERADKLQDLHRKLRVAEQDAAQAIEAMTRLLHTQHGELPAG
jgi:hypothetical protein